MRRLVCIAMIALASGCFFGDLDGLAGPPLSDDGPDGSSPERNDAAAEADAKGEAASDAAVDAGSSPCSASHVLCADFDHGPVQMGFDAIDDMGQGSLALGMLSLSAPFSMHASTPRKADTSPWFQSLDKSFPMAWRRVVLQGDINIKPISWQMGDINVAFANVIFLSSTVNTGTVWFAAENDAAGTIEDPKNNNTQYLPLPQPPFGQWAHIVIDFDPGGHLHYNIGGKTVDKSFPAFTAGANPLVKIQVGILGYNNPAPPIDVHWDNVFVDFR